MTDKDNQKANSGEGKNPVLQVIRATFPIRIFGITWNELTRIEWYQFFTRMAFMGFFLAYLSAVGILGVLLLEGREVDVNNILILTNPMVIGAIVLIVIALTGLVELVNEGGKVEFDHLVPYRYEGTLSALIKLLIGAGALVFLFSMLSNVIGTQNSVIEFIRILILTLFIVGMLLIGAGFCLTSLYDFLRLRRD